MPRLRKKKFTIPEDWVKVLKKLKVIKEDVNRLVMNFLLTEGYVEAAQKFQLESGTEVDVDLINDCIAIKEAVQSGNVMDAIEITNSLNPEILDSNPSVLFHLRDQQLIELIRSGKIADALEFAHHELTPMVEKNPEFLEELNGTLVLLAFEDVNDCPVSGLLDISRRLKIANEVTVAIITTQSHEKVPKLKRVIKIVKWVQKRLLDKKVAHSQIKRINWGAG